jgi:tRNA-2-methylthio-N6-dimethylallyladenosine synthase
VIDMELQLKDLETVESRIGKEFEILVEGFSKRSRDKVVGRTSQNKVVVIPTARAGTPPDTDLEANPEAAHKPGDYVKVRITSCTSATLQGEEVLPG